MTNQGRIGCLLWSVVLVFVLLWLAQFWPDANDPRVIRETVPCDTPLDEVGPILRELEILFDDWVQACN